MANIFETISNLSDSVRNGKDNIYRISNKVAETIKDKSAEIKSTTSKKVDEETERDNKKTRDAAAERLKKQQNESDISGGEIRIDGEVVEVAGPINIDKNRKSFEEVGEYNDVTMKSGVLLGNDIEDWLKGTLEQIAKIEDDDYAEYLAKKNGTSQQTMESVDVKKMRKRIQMAESLKQEFETSGSFDKKTEMYNQISGLDVSEDNITKTANLSYIFSAFCGDLNAKALLNAIKNNSSEIRMAAAIRKCLDGDISQEMTTQKIFAEIHGINSTLLEDKIYQDEALVYLAALQELSPQADISDVMSMSAAELKSLRDAVVTGKTFNNKKFLAEMGVRNNVNKVLETGDICVTNLELNGRTDGYICYDLNIDTDNVDIMMNRNEEITLLGSANENGMISGSLEAITSELTRHDIKDAVENALTEEINHNRDITHNEALRNKLSEAELKQIKQEEDLAVQEAMKRRGFGSAV